MVFRGKKITIVEMIAEMRECEYFYKPLWRRLLRWFSGSARRLPFHRRRKLEGGQSMSAFGGIDTTRLLVSGMKVAQDHVRITANNIANVDTPGYNPVHLDFQATLRDALEGRGTFSLRKTLPQHLEMSRQHLGTGVLVRTSKNDYNKVDIEEEIANLSEYRGKYVVYSSLLTKQFSMVKNMLATAR